jgi:hypothetical protein
MILGGLGQGVRRVVEDGRDGRGAGVEEALDAGLGVVERLQLSLAVVSRNRCPKSR